MKKLQVDAMGVIMHLKLVEGVNQAIRDFG